MGDHGSPEKNRWNLAAFVVLIGFSRVYLGDHRASDVISAFLIGETLSGFAVGLYLPLKERGTLQTSRARAHMKTEKALRSFPTKGMVMVLLE